MRIDPDGIDLDWYAVDRDGHLAHFTSGGSRLVPERVLASQEDLKKVDRILQDSPANGRALSAWTSCRW